MHYSSRFHVSALIIAVSAAVVFSACASLGPSTLDKDPLDYGARVGDNWKRLTTS